MAGDAKPVLEEKRWSPEYEEEMIRIWKEEDWWKFELDERPLLVVDTPPPYPAPVWHIGAAASYSMQDIIVRAHRMLGYNVLYPIGMDRNGIPVELYVEKYENVDMWKMDRTEFEGLCRKYLDMYSGRMIDILRRLEISYDWEGQRYQTDSPEYRALTQKTFAMLWEKGLIYEAERPNNWCPKCRTTVADAEVEHDKRAGKLYYVRFDLADGGEVIIATTRPELIGACRAIIVHPEDERYADLVGKKAVVPIFGVEVPIVTHKEANPEFGTGAVMICSFGDFTDVRLFRELGLEPVKMIDVDGKMTEEAGKYAGLTVKEAKEKIVEDLKAEGRIVEEEEIEHSVPIHDKCKHEIEIIPMPEYYLKQTGFKEVLSKYADEIEWFPEKYRQHLKNWVNSVTVDWPISRRRYYGTEVPIWTCRKCGYKYVYSKGDRYVKPWKEDPGIDCPECGAHDWEGEWRTLDTWMDSSISVLFITRWQRDEEFFERAWKGIKLRPQGYDIIRTWLYYTLLRVHQLLGERAFDWVFINGMGVDEHGRKMSKSLGNVIDPEYILEKYGADALRLAVALECSIGENYRMSEERIEGAFKFLTKLWNIARFVSMFPVVEEKPALTPTDEWILSELNKVIERSVEGYRKMDFHIAALEVRRFTWNVFASHYIEMVKRRARQEGFTEEEAKAAWWTLHRVLRSILLLLAPITPAITDKIYRAVYGECVHTQRFPEREDVNDYAALTQEIMDFNSYVWNTKKEKGIKFREPIEGVDVPENLKPFEKDLKALHSIV